MLLFCRVSCTVHFMGILMNIDVYNTKYTLEEIAAQCKAAIKNDKLRGKVKPTVYQDKYRNCCE